MKKHRLSLIVLLALIACGAALAVLPARWIMAAVPASWPLAVVDANGTIWSGSATIAIGPPSRRRSLPDPLDWRLSLVGGPKLHLAHPWLGGPLIVSAGWRGIGISAQTLRLPASALGTLDARVAAVDPGGDLSIKWPATFVGAAKRPPGTVLLDAQWRNAVSALTPIRPLGDYDLALKQAAENRIDVVLGTRNGPLMLTGAGALEGGNRFSFEGTAQADPAAGSEIHAALRDLLAALGPRRNNQTLLRFR
ncbi:type II secretion system protein N [Parapusillimonas sp. JC17]|uniref:type II secretion system protein N n=1 Tax=Parapusillimonas sp. JC17 TaxID=3445768 RepID=UPI003FA11AE2